MQNILNNARAARRFSMQEIVARVFDIQTFGAANDGFQVCTAAIQRALDSAAASGGGTVTIPRGVWVTGPLQLHSRVRLHLSTPESVLKATTDLSAWPAVPWQARPGFHRCPCTALHRSAPFLPTSLPAEKTVTWSASPPQAKRTTHRIPIT